MENKIEEALSCAITSMDRIAKQDKFIARHSRKIGMLSVFTLITGVGIYIHEKRIQKTESRIDALERELRDIRNSAELEKELSHEAERER